MNDNVRNITINDILYEFKKYNNNKKDIDLINKAYDYAYKKHFGKSSVLHRFNSKI